MRKAARRPLEDQPENLATLGARLWLLPILTPVWIKDRKTWAEGYTRG